MIKINLLRPDDDYIQLAKFENHSFRKLNNNLS